MWIFFPHAMLSIVAHRERRDTLLVRARFKGDIERAFPAAKVKRTPRADYLYRAEVSRKVVAAALSEHVTDMDYTNVKGAIPRGDFRRNGAMHDIWQVMFDAQHSSEPFARMDAAEEEPAQAPSRTLRAGNYYAHTTTTKQARTVLVKNVQDRAFGEPDVTLEYVETNHRTTAPMSQAARWLRNAELLP